jgi:hypothetical protein
MQSAPAAPPAAAPPPVPAPIPGSALSAQNQAALTTLNNALANGYNVPVPFQPAQTKLMPEFASNPTTQVLDQLLGAPALPASQANSSSVYVGSDPRSIAAFDQLNNAFQLGYNIAFPAQGAAAGENLKVLTSIGHLRQERIADLIISLKDYMQATGNRDANAERQIVALGQSSKSYMDDVTAINAASGRLTQAQTAQLATAAESYSRSDDPTAFHNLKVQLLGS